MIAVHVSATEPICWCVKHPASHPVAMTSVTLLTWPLFTVFRLPDIPYYNQKALLFFCSKSLLVTMEYQSNLHCCNAIISKGKINK